MPSDVPKVPAKEIRSKSKLKSDKKLPIYQIILLDIEKEWYDMARI
jgi:hypothetical protein